MTLSSSLLPLFAALLFGTGAAAAQAVPRTDTPRAGTLRVTFEPVVTTWEREFTDTGRLRIGANLPAPVFVRAERRVTPLMAEFGISNRVSLGVRLPLVRVRVQAGYHRDSTGAADSGSAALDSLLAASTYLFAPVRNTPRRLRYFPGDAELQAKYLLFVAPSYRTAVTLVVRFPTGHLESPHDLFDISTGDHQTDVEVQVAQELTLFDRLWLNALVRVARQQPGQRERRVRDQRPGPQGDWLVPRAATVVLDWDPGDYMAIDVSPMYRFSPNFGAGFTAGYWTKKRDHYAYRSAADSSAVLNALGAQTPARVLDAGTSERWLWLGVAVTYVGPDMEGSVSFEQTVTGSGGRVPAATVFRVLMRTSRWPF